MMKPGQTCATCNAHAPLAKQCRANPPLAVAVNGPQGQIGAIGIWPAVDESHWCRHWAPDAPQA